MGRYEPSPDMKALAFVRACCACCGVDLAEVLVREAADGGGVAEFRKLHNTTQRTLHNWCSKLPWSMDS